MYIHTYTQAHIHTKSLTSDLVAIVASPVMIEYRGHKLINTPQRPSETTRRKDMIAANPTRLYGYTQEYCCLIVLKQVFVTQVDQSLDCHTTWLRLGIL